MPTMTGRIVRIDLLIIIMIFISYKPTFDNDSLSIKIRKKTSHSSYFFSAGVANTYHRRHLVLDHEFAFNVAVCFALNLRPISIRIRTTVLSLTYFDFIYICWVCLWSLFWR